jgi:hypothetical protein
MSCSAKNLPCFVLTTCGLEATSAKELAMLPNISINSISYRRISATFSGSLAALCS